MMMMMMMMIIFRSREKNSDIVEIYTWLTDNNMVAHPDKSETMMFGSKHALKKECEVDIYLDKTKLKEMSSYKYLGVVTSEVNLEI